MSWAAVEHRVLELGLSAEQRANFSRLVTCLEVAPLPHDVTKSPYEAAISLHWARYEIAIFADRFETYRFGDGETIIRHWVQAPDAPIATELVDEVKSSAS
jgi:hypothetical protein